jgi:uncharacterized protein (UPF0333 family)
MNNQTKGGLTMFDKRGQSALEYLMTYGWALIVIAIVIGVLIFVTGSATGGVTCQSQSTALVLKEWTVSAGTNGVGLTLMNASGGSISIVDANITVPANTDFVENTAVVGGADYSAGQVAKNKSFTVTGINGPTAGQTFSNGKVNVAYNTAGGLPATAVIVCSGTV